MPLIAYEPKRFSVEHVAMIDIANEIMREYARDGFDLTLRQLYYQFVAHDHFPDDRTWTQIEGTNKWRRDPNGTKNADPNYKWLGGLINDARLGGLIDWRTIVDRTRGLSSSDGYWDSPEQIIESSAQGYSIPYWGVQPNYIEVWIEKEALAGVIERVCRELKLPHLSCRGYTSQSEMWRAGQRIGREIRGGKEVTILHLGDHDPSGIDMSRDINDRITDFLRHDNGSDDGFNLKRIALNMEQIREFDPPPNPAKLSDSRGRGYVEFFGNESWELDALNPQVLSDLVRTNVEPLIDRKLWDETREREETETEQLELVIGKWDRIVEFLEADAA